MKIATFNINGVKARLPAVLDWLSRSAPDVALLQEIKSADDGFPRAAFEGAGYAVETHGQKGFNGVAILSKRPLEDIRRGLPGLDGAPDADDAQSRWIEALAIGERGAVRVCGLYAPNGNPSPGPKYDYKLAWMARLERRATELLASEETALMAGDYNVMPQAEDVARPDDWRDDALFRPETRAAYHQLSHLGFTDAFRTLHPQAETYSFWDYQAGAWRKNDGIGIDHILLTPQAADRLRAAGVEKSVRGGEKPSDHTPVWCDLDV